MSEITRAMANIVEEPLFRRGRTYFKLSADKAIRQEMIDRRDSLSGDELEAALKEYGVEILDPREDIARVCFDYAFERVGLNDYRTVDGLRRMGRIIGKDLNGLAHVSLPDPGDLVFYFDMFRLRRLFMINKVRHVGIVAEDKRIDSKWGNCSVYRHLIGAVPPEYGDYVMFARKVER